MSAGVEQAKTAVKTPATDGWRQTPEAVLEAVRKAETGVAALQEIAHGYGLNRKFTLDGRLVGDIGELLLCPDFEVLPDHKPDGHAHDLVGEARAGRVQVQVKLRRATKGGRIEFKYQPECLVVIECAEDWSKWRILYNGPGSVVTEEEIEVRPEDRRILREGRPHTVYMTRPHLRLTAEKLTAGDLSLSARDHGLSQEP
jgi:hypothetical protein